MGSANINDNTCIDNKYYECNSLKDSDLCNKQFVYRALHLNVQSFPSKHDDLKLLLANFQEASTSFDFILLCDTLFPNNNLKLFSIPGYKVLRKCTCNEPRVGCCHIYQR